MLRILAFCWLAIVLTSCSPHGLTGMRAPGTSNALAGDDLVEYVEGHTLSLRYEDATGTLFAEDGRFELFNSRVAAQEGNYRYNDDELCLTFKGFGESCRQILSKDGVRSLEGDNARKAIIIVRSTGNIVDIELRAAAFPEQYPDDQPKAVVVSQANSRLTTSPGAQPTTGVLLTETSTTTTPSTGPNLQCSAVREQCVAACDASGAGISCKAACFAAHDQCVAGQ